MTEVFNFDDYLEKMMSDKREHIPTIAAYFKHKGIRFDNLGEVREGIKRHTRAAVALIPFSTKKIRDAVTYCDKNYKDVNWTLETVLKVLTSK